MKTILIPTDFSDCAANALRYAADFAASLKQDVRLVVLHVVNVQVMLPEEPLEIVFAEQEELKKNAEVKINLLVEEYSNRMPMVQCSGHVRTGLFLQEIENMVKEAQADLLIMGTCGVHDFPESVFATNTYSVVKRNLTDVLVVPDGLRFRPFKTLVFAADLDEKNSAELQKTITWAQPTNARILVTHIENYDTEDLAGSQLMSDLWDHVRSGNNYPNVEYNTELANTIEEGLEKVLDRTSVDLLVMCPRKYTFLENLLHSSHTRHAVQHPETVVLCLAATNN